jgi:hypothetical protein
MVKKGLTIVETNAQIALKMNKEIAAYLNRMAKAKYGYIEGKLKPVVASAIASSPEISSLQSGKLKMDFGLNHDPTQGIITAITETVEVKLGTGISPRSLKGTLITINVQPTSLSNLLNQSFAFQQTEEGYLLPWFRWLTTAGDTPVVMDYDVSYGNYRQSRAGGAIMKKGGAFRVDPTYSGTREENFISRALSSNALLREIDNILTKAFK